MPERAVLFLAWGDRFVAEVGRCLHRSGCHLSGFDRVLITDSQSDISEVEPHLSRIIRVEFEQDGLLRKTEIWKHLPDGYDSFLFLDSDTTVIADISLGFEKAEKHGIAASPAPHYSLDAFWGFGEVMAKAQWPGMGQLQYNTGVIFFSRTASVSAVFQAWGSLAERYSIECRNDQPYFSLALEQLGFNPYTLSISYNYRGFGEAISGDVRIWHSHGSVPKDINHYEIAWPPRRAWPGRVVFPSLRKRNLILRVLGRCRRFLIAFRSE